jgi:hypothetical protein
MTLPEFKRSLEAALKLHFPNARLILAEKVLLLCFLQFKSR